VTHEVLLANETWAQYEADGRALAEKRAALVRHEFEARRPYEEAVVAHKAAVAEAVESGEMPPPAPQPPDLRHLDSAKALLRTQEEAHRERKDAVLAEIATDVLNALGDRERVDNAEAAQIAPRLRRLVTRRSADLSLVALVIGAVDREAGLSTHPSRAERVPRSIAVEALLAAAEADVSVLEPVPMLGPPAGRVLPDDGRGDGIPHAPPQRLGMSRGFGGDLSDWPTVQHLPPGRV
jgi:hypothetical protein